MRALHLTIAILCVVIAGLGAAQGAWFVAFAWLFCSGYQVYLLFNPEKLRPSNWFWQAVYALFAGVGLTLGTLCLVMGQSRVGGIEMLCIGLANVGWYFQGLPKKPKEQEASRRPR